MIELSTSLLIAAVSAFLLAMFGYLKNMEEEDFQPSKIFVTVLSALIAALLYVFWKVPFTTSSEIITVLLIQTGVTSLLERILKWLWRSYIKDRLPPEWFPSDPG